MRLLLGLKNFVNRFQSALTDAGREVRKEGIHAFASAFDELKGDAESLASGVKAYSSVPPAFLNVFRKAPPVRVGKS
jgi:hypothetical protein